MLRILENLVTDLKLSYFMNEKFSQNISDEQTDDFFVFAGFLIMVLLRTALVYILGSYLYNITIVKSFGVKKISGMQAVALSFLLDILM